MQIDGLDYADISRDDHLAWCKRRALEYIDRGDVRQGLTGFFSDLNKHPETRGHADITRGFTFMMHGGLRRPHIARRFIERIL